ncbi:hypothetical protein [Maribacter halichondriae]|uniref:hypothetical protein n=1 Tax=Maribacter halichondriae TaxID=2980554 RepID=UPI00235936C0|nr:hypothetical protein [Maribacter sp. Hal144]
MITFFGILFILIGINAVLMIFSINGVDQKIKKSTDGDSETSTSKIYPIDLISSKYKKAV